MKKKIAKIIISIVFCVAIIASLLLITADLPGEDDMFGTSFDFAITMMFCVIVVSAELDLFYNCLYIFSNKKTKRNTVFNIICGAISCSIFAVLIFNYVGSLNFFNDVISLSIMVKIEMLLHNLIVALPALLILIRIIQFITNVATNITDRGE